VIKTRRLAERERNAGTLSIAEIDELGRVGWGGFGRPPIPAATIGTWPTSTHSR
jgi:hypothetical protein